MAQYLGQVVAVVLGMAIAATPAERIRHAEFCSVFKGTAAYNAGHDLLLDDVL